MHKCLYGRIDGVPIKDKDPDGKDNCKNHMFRKFLIRQIIICSGTWSSFFAFGLSFGSPTVIIPQLRREANSTEAVSMEMASSLSSTVSYSSLISSLILVILAGRFGRKLIFLLVSVTSVIGYIIFYCSKTTTHLLISEVIHGPLAASPTISIMIVTEYTTPRYRGVFLTFTSASFIWGVWVSNTIGTFFHWKNIGILGIVCTTYCLLSAFFWPESPYWLATRNRFEDCARSHRWLRGCAKESEAELEAMMPSRKFTNTIERDANHLQKILKMLSSKIFYKPVLLSCLIFCMHNFSGKLACGMYAIDIIKRITKTESSAYNGMLILDAVTILGMYVGCGLSKTFKRKFLFLNATVVGLAFSYSLSLYLYLIYLKIVSEYIIVSFSLLLGYSLAISVGPMNMSTPIVGELIPIKYRNSIIIVLVCVNNFLLGTVLKITPFIIQYIDICGLFLFFAIAVSFFTIIAYIVLPETKDKSLLEIQEMLLQNDNKNQQIKI